MARFLRRHALLVALFLVLQALDLLLTRSLLAGGPDSAGEANPVAALVLGRAGWAGLAAFKVASCAVSLAAAGLVGRARPGLGRALLGVLCLAVLAVVGYSLTLRWREEADRRDEAAVLAAEDRRLRHELDTLNEFLARKDEACRGLLDGRLGLDEASDELGRALEECGWAMAPATRRQMPGPQDRAALGAYLLRAAGATARAPDRAGRLGELEREYAERFGRQPRPGPGSAAGAGELLTAR